MRVAYAVACEYKSSRGPLSWQLAPSISVPFTDFETQMTTLHRFQIDLTKEELNSIERLGTLAGLRTKKEVILNAITLFRWAAKEILSGRTICSIDERTKAIKQLELPALTAVVDKRIEPLTDEQVQERLATGSRRFSESKLSSSGGMNVTTVLDNSSGSGVDGGLGTSTQK